MPPMKKNNITGLSPSCFIIQWSQTLPVLNKHCDLGTSQNSHFGYFSKKTHRHLSCHFKGAMLQPIELFSTLVYLKTSLLD